VLSRRCITHRTESTFRTRRPPYIYFTLLSAPEGHKASKSFIVVNNELKKCGMKSPRPNLRSHPLICLEEPTKITYKSRQSESRTRFRPNTSRIGLQIASISARASLLGHIQLQAHSKNKGILAAGNRSFPRTFEFAFRFIFAMPVSYLWCT
jgi:hypothetical protein